MPKEKRSKMFNELTELALRRKRKRGKFKKFKINKIDREFVATHNFKSHIKNDNSKIEIIPVFKKNRQQPWKNYYISRKYIYQCHCKGSKEFFKTIKKNRTTINRDKLLPYQDKIEIEFRNKPYIIDIYQYRKNIVSGALFKFSKKNFYGQFLKTFQLSYQLPLSRNVQIILNSFKNKYIYYAIDDILCLLDSNSNERDNLLQIIYSCMLSLHNEFSVNFFDIWIDSVYFNDNFETNRFLKSKVTNKNSNLTISIKLHYFKRMPIKKPEPIW